jgi:hypothetical protein
VKQNPAVSSSRAAHFVARLDMASPDPPLATRPIACPERSDTGFADANLDVGTAILLAVASANGQARASDRARRFRRRPFRVSVPPRRPRPSPPPPCASSQVEAARCRAVCKNWASHVDAWLMSVGPSLDLSAAGAGGGDQDQDQDPDPRLVVASTLAATREGCPKLRHLSVKGCRGVSADAMAAVAAGCANLTHADLSDSDVDDDALRAFVDGGGAARLKELDVSGCARVTADGLLALARACGSLSVFVATRSNGVTGECLRALIETAGETLRDARFDESVLSAGDAEAVAKRSGVGRFFVETHDFGGEELAIVQVWKPDEEDGACM